MGSTQRTISAVNPRLFASGPAAAAAGFDTDSPRDLRRRGSGIFGRRFHLFQKLPPELRARIWTLAFEPRILRIGLYYRFVNGPGASYTVLPVVRPSDELAKATRDRCNLLRTCAEARMELLRFLPDSLPIEPPNYDQSIKIPFHRQRDLICFDYVSALIFTDPNFTKLPDLPPMSFPVQSIAFDEDFVFRHMDSAIGADSLYHRIGSFLEMMPCVRRVCVVNTCVHIERAAYHFRIMDGRHGKWICLNHEPRGNPNVLYQRDFVRSVEVGQELCAILRHHEWEEPMMRRHGLAVFVLCPSSNRSGRGSWQ